MIHLICGYQDLRGSFIDETRLRTMAAAMVPADHAAGIDVAIEGQIGLAVVGIHKSNPFTRKEYLDPPRIYNASDLMIAADISIYNLNQLARKLDAAAEPLVVIAQLYRRYGRRGLDQVEGDFTLALALGIVLVSIVILINAMVSLVQLREKRHQ